MYGLCTYLDHIHQWTIIYKNTVSYIEAFKKDAIVWKAAYFIYLESHVLYPGEEMTLCEERTS